MLIKREEIESFLRRRAECKRFWKRLGGAPPLAGKTVLDVGCGRGALCVEMGLAGARKVVGLDISSELVEWARQNVRLNHTDLAGVLEFVDCELSAYPRTRFDYVVSKDTFEHVIGLDDLLKEIKLRLHPEGTVFAGFGPLWNSPFGDHGRAQLRLPWAHVVLSESAIMKRLQSRGRDAHSLADLGLNGMSFSEYIGAFRRAGLSPVQITINAGDHPVYKLASVLRTIPPLREYFTFNLYCAFRPFESCEQA